jgi:malonyl-CoA O-methyltransferase
MTLVNFERLGGAFSNRSWTRDPVFQRVLASEVDEWTPGVWLEVGCGVGDFARCIERPDSRIIGIDLAYSMLRSAKERSRWITGIQADAHSLPIESETVDAVFSRNVLQHCSSPARVLEEMTRACKVEGRILIVESCATGDEDRRFMDQIIAMAEPGQARSRTPHDWSVALAGADILVDEQRVFTHKVSATADYLVEQFGMSPALLPDYFGIFSAAPQSVRQMRKIRVIGTEKLEFLLFWTALFGRRKIS